MENETVEAAKDKAAQVAGDLASAAKDTVGAVQERAADRIGDLKSATIDLGDSAAAKGQAVLDDPGAAWDEVTGTARRNPAALLALVVLGALALLLVLRRRRSD